VKVLITPRVGAAVAAGVEETGACAGTKELSNGVRSGLNVGCADSSTATPEEVFCRRI
jgi:hypothetical protein